MLLKNSPAMNWRQRKIFIMGMLSISHSFYMARKWSIKSSGRLFKSYNFSWTEYYCLSLHLVYLYTYPCILYLTFILTFLHELISHCKPENLKETRNSQFCITPKNHRLMFFLWEILKSTVTKKVSERFYNLGEANF